MIVKNSHLRYLLTGLIFAIFLVVIVTFNDQILSKNNPVNSNVLVIEGWLASYNLELLQKKINLDNYKTIIVTGISHDHPDIDQGNKYEIEKLPCSFYTNGCLIINKLPELTLLSDSIATIIVYAHGSRVLDRYANFFIGVDDSVIGNSFVTSQNLPYTFHYKAPQKIKNIYIYFNNDLTFEKEDRNLVVDSVSLNGFSFNKPYQYLKIYDGQLNQNLYTPFPFHSNSGLTASYLKVLNVKNNIITIDTFFNKRNKTLAAARKLESFLETHMNDAKSINVVSVNKHSRRSYMAYKIATKNKREIGIISLDDSKYKNKPDTWSYIFSVFDEYFKTFITTIEFYYYRIIG